MTVKDIVTQIEMLYGKKPHTYIFRLINDCLLDIASEVQHLSKTGRHDLTQYRRWYVAKDFVDVNNNASTDVVDIYRVEILDSDSRYNLIPKITDQHKLLKDDTDDASLSHDSTATNSNTGDVTS